MAIGNISGRNNLEKLSWYLNNRSHTVWDRFRPDEQQQMVNDDLFAGRSVSMVLAALITSGLVLSAVTLLAVLLSG